MNVFVLGKAYSLVSCIAKPTDRLFNVLSRCGGPKRLADLNAIHFYHDSDTLIVRGNEYFINGDLTKNPHLLDGDVIFIPKAISYEQTVTVQGGVLEPGLYPIYRNENLSQFLSQYINYSEDVQLGLVTVTRLVNNQKKIIEIDLNGSDVKKKLQEFILEPGDIIEIGILSQVYVQGEVNIPGVYPFISSFKAIDYVGLAGGNTNKGRVRTVHVIHKNGNRSKGLYTDIQRGDVIIVPRSFAAVFIGNLGVLQVISTLVSVILTIDVVSRSK